MGLLGFPAQENIVSTEKLHACMALDISNIWPLGSAGCIRYDYTGCPRRNVQYFVRVFLMLNYTDITQNTYIQS